MRRSRMRIAALALKTATGAVLGASVAALGADTWDNGSIVSPGQWSVGANWADDTEPTLADAVTFPTPMPGGLSTITLSPGEQALSLTLNDGYTLTGGSLTLGAGGSISVAAGELASIGSTLNGTGGLTKSGIGQLILSASNGFSGAVAVNDGTLRLQNPSALGVSTSAVVVNSATLECDGVTLDRSLSLSNGAQLQGRQSAAFHGTMTVASGADIFVDTGTEDSGVLRLGNAANDLTGGGGGSQIGVAGAGKLVLAQSSNYAGDWTIIGSGTVEIAADNRLGNAGNTVTFEAGILATTTSFSSSRLFTMGSLGGIFAPAPGTTFTVNSALASDANNLSARGGGTLLLTAASARTGPNTVSTNGIIRLAHSAALGTGTIFVASGGRLELSSVSVGQATTLQAGGEILGLGVSSYTGTITCLGGSIGASGIGTLIITSGLAGTVDSLTKTQSGTLVLNAGSARTGLNHLNGGTLRVQSPTALGSGAIDIQSGATLDVSGVTVNQPISLLNGGWLRGTGTAAVTGAVSVASGAEVNLDSGTSSTNVLTIGDSVNDLTGGGSGSQIGIVGIGKLVLAQPSNCTGNWFVIGGTLQAGADDRLGNAANSVTNSGRFLTNGTFSSARSFLVSSGAFEVTAGNTFTLTSGLTGSGPVTINTAGGGSGGTMVLAAASSYTGDWNIFNHTVRVQNASALGPGSGAVVFGGTLATSISFSSARTFTPNNGVVSIDEDETVTFAGALGTATGYLWKLGAGTLELSASSARTSNTIITEGTVRLLNGSALGSGAIGLSGSEFGTVLEIASVTVDQPIHVDSGPIIRGGGGGIASCNGAITVQADEELTLDSGASPADVLAIGNSANDITGGGDSTITVTGAGKVLLNQPSDFGGQWVVSSGRLLISGDDRLGDPTNGLTLDGGTLVTVAHIISNRKITLGAGGGTIDSSGTDSSWGDLDPGNFTKNGAGKVFFRSLEALDVTVNAGTLGVKDRATTGGNHPARMTQLNIDPSAALDLNDNDLVVHNGNFTAIAALVLAGFGNTTGIISSTSDGSQILALFDNALVGASEWAGQPIGANAIVGKYTYFGDANLDGQVSGDDYTVVDANLNTTPALGLEWLSGDANLDGAVTGDDYTVIDANLGLGTGNPLATSSLRSAASLNAVPEPSPGVAIIALLPLAARRARRPHSEEPPRLPPAIRIARDLFQ